jgi:cobalt-zinc-cadmium resistance protein CzcA
MSEEILIPPESSSETASLINRIVSTALRQRFLTLLLAVLLIGGGWWSFSRLPVDAYPDLSPPQVEINAQWAGHAAEEVERLITVPLEVEMNGIPHLTALRSISLYGLSDVRMTFEYGTDSYFVRQLAFQRMGGASLPEGVAPDMAPLFSPSGLIYRYVLQSPDRSPMELKTLEDWVIERQYRSVPGVADDSGLGGQTMEYHVVLDPTKVAGAGLSVNAIGSALESNNGNAGGGFYSQGGQFYYVRGLGRIRTPEDIENTVVSVHDGIPVLVKDVGRVEIGYAPRLGQFGFNRTGDAVEGVILMRKGEQAQVVLKRVQNKTSELNNSILPKDVKIHPFYDRSDLIALTTRTVEKNLLRGMVLVIIVLIFFLYNVRSGLIVAVTIPLSLMFAFMCLDLKNIPANLLSIGAIDFGILVDGAVVMVENIFRQLALRQGQKYNVKQVIVAAAAEVDRPIFYAVAVIVAGFLPIYVLSGPSGELFKPMASTMIYALIGSLAITLTLVPVLCSWALRKGVQEKRNAILEAIKSAYGKGLDACLGHPWITTAASVLILAGTLLLVPKIGAEFMPHLDEGALWIRATMPYTISFEESKKITPKIREILLSYPEVTVVGSEHGRPDDGTDPTGFFNAEFYVGLKPYSEWHGKYKTKDQLIDAIMEKLQAFPGITFNHTQPAEDAVDEAETGLKSALAVKIFGGDLSVLEKKGEEIKRVVQSIPGMDHVTLVRELGQPSLTITANRANLARYGLNVSDINSLIEAAVGGTAVTQVVQGEKLFDLVIRLEPRFRETPEEIGNILVATPGGQQIPLKEFANIQLVSGASFIYRENNSRYIGVQYSVEGRDLAGTVEEAQRQVAAKVKLPEGYRVIWGGEYQEYTASRRQLQIVLPLTLFVIFLLLFALYGNFKFPLITVIGVLLSAPAGGLIALWLTGTPFSVSSGIGFLALFGVSVQTAVVYISYANELRQGGMELHRAAHEAALLRLRPIMMTALVAALGLLPAALSTDVGSDSQRPFALVIVSGLFSRLLISVFLMPALYAIVARPGDRLEV